MDLRKIKKLMELLEESGIAEIEVKEGEESIKLSRNMTSSSMPIQQVIQPSAVPSQPSPIQQSPENINATESSESEKRIL